MTHDVVDHERGPSARHAAQRHLRVLQDRSDLDLGAARQAVADLLSALGKDPSSEHLVDTPRRVAAGSRSG